MGLSASSQRRASRAGVADASPPRAEGLAEEHEILGADSTDQEATDTALSSRLSRLFGRSRTASASSAGSAPLGDKGEGEMEPPQPRYLTSWRAVPSLQVEAPTPRSGHTAVCDGEYMYVWGGYHMRQCYAQLYRLHLATRTWQRMRLRGVVSSQTASHSAVLVGHRMYCFGGSGPNFGHMNSDLLLVCDLRTGRWRHAQPLDNAHSSDSGADGESEGDDVVPQVDAAHTPEDRLWSLLRGNMDALDDWADWGLSAPADRADVLAALRGMLGWAAGEGANGDDDMVTRAMRRRDVTRARRHNQHLRRRRTRGGAGGSAGEVAGALGDHEDGRALGRETAPGDGEGEGAEGDESTSSSSSGMSTGSDTDSETDSAIESESLSASDDMDDEAWEDDVDVGEHARLMATVAEPPALHLPAVPPPYGGQTGQRPNPRYGQSMVLAGDKLYVFGGTAGSVFYGDLHSYDIGTGVWAHVPPSANAPTPRYRHECVTVGHRLFVVGGGMPDPDPQSDGAHMITVCSFDTLEGVWQRHACKPADGRSLPLSRRSHSCVVHDNSIFMFGGTNGHAVFGDLWQLDTTTFEWHLLHGDLPRPRETFSVGGYLAGFSGAGVGADGEGVGPCPRYFHSACISRGGLLTVFGGCLDTTGQNRCSDAYMRWVCVPSLLDLCVDAVARAHAQDSAEIKDLMPEALFQRVFGSPTERGT